MKDNNLLLMNIISYWMKFKKAVTTKDTKAYNFVYNKHFYIRFCAFCG